MFNFAHHYPFLSFFLLGLCLPAAAQPALEFGMDNGIYARDRSTNFSLQLNGRLHVDYVNARLEDETMVNDAQVKRVWLTLSGGSEDWYFLSRFNIDREEGDTPLANFVEYRGFGKLAYVSVGRHKEPFGMSWRSSINHSSTPERSAISDRYTFGRNVGAMMRGYSPLLGYEVGIFEDGDGQADTEAEHMAFTGRIFSPVFHNGEHLLHLGAGVSARHQQDALGLELLYIRDRWHLQSEWMSSRPDTAEGDGSSDDIAGIYLETGWFFTPDRMAYGNGALKNVQPSSAGGAWQMVVRWDNGDGNYADMQLGNGDGYALALGLNWFATSHARLALSYTRGEVADLIGEEVRLRAQFIF